MTKKVVVMTGATSGFGVNWFQTLVSEMYAEFYVLARSESKYQLLLASVPADIQPNIHFVACNLASLESIAKAIKYINQQVTKVDLLINNAGVFSSDVPSFNSADTELTFLVNHLAPLLITLSLQDKLKESVSPRVVNTSSFQHVNANLKLADLSFNHSKYNAMLAYQNSKLCNLLSTRYLSQYLNNNISINCFDPGIVDTSMTKEALPKLLSWAHPILCKFFRNKAKGAETGIYLSLSDTVKNQTGGYYRDRKLKQPSKAALSSDIGEQLHQISIDLIRPYLPCGAC